MDYAYDIAKLLNMIEVRRDFGFILAVSLVVLYSLFTILVVRRDIQDSNKIRLAPR